jgi:hypothetical protein
LMSSVVGFDTLTMLRARRRLDPTRYAAQAQHARLRGRVPEALRTGGRKSEARPPRRHAGAVASLAGSSSATLPCRARPDVVSRACRCGIMARGRGLTAAPPSARSLCNRMGRRHALSSPRVGEARAPTPARRRGGNATTTAGGRSRRRRR